MTVSFDSHRMWLVTKKNRGEDSYPMDINKLDLLAEKSKKMPEGLLLHEQGYFIASRGLYSQYAAGEIPLAQAKEEKIKVIQLYRMQEKQEVEKQVIYLNKKKVVKAIVLELDRYISCGLTNEHREQAYPRTLFEKRIIELIDEAYEH